MKSGPDREGYLQDHYSQKTCMENSIYILVEIRQNSLQNRAMLDCKHSMNLKGFVIVEASIPGIFQITTLI